MSTRRGAFLWYLLRGGERIRSTRADSLPEAFRRLEGEPGDVIQSAASAAIPMHPGVEGVTAPPPRLCTRCQKTMTPAEALMDRLHPDCRASERARLRDRKAAARRAKAIARGLR
jgi:hypothetical protein